MTGSKRKRGDKTVEGATSKPSSTPTNANTQTDDRRSSPDIVEVAAPPAKKSTRRTKSGFDEHWKTNECTNKEVLDTFVRHVRCALH